MQIDEIRKLSDQEIQSRVLELKGNLLNLRFQQKAGPYG